MLLFVNQFYFSLEIYMKDTIKQNKTLKLKPLNKTSSERNKNNKTKKKKILIIESTPSSQEKIDIILSEKNGDKLKSDLVLIEEQIKTNSDFALRYGELGPIYGKQWRSWIKYTKGDYVMEEQGHIHYTDSIDQIQNLINDLKTNPDSRRLMVNAWNVGELDQMVLPPCHYGFQVYTRELSARERTALGSNGSTRLYDSIKEENYKTIDADREMHKVCDEAGVPKRTISLMWNQRSIDSFLGLPFNIASYGLLLEIIAKEVNMVPDELIGNLGDTHLYSNHIEQAKEQIGREPYELPKLGMDYREGEYNKNLTNFVTDDFYLIDYQSHPTIKAPLSN